MFQNWIGVLNLIIGLVPNNKPMLCFDTQARFFFDPRHFTPFVSTSFVLNLLGFLFTFQPHSFCLSCCFEWGRERRGERECSQFRHIPPWLELLFSGSEYEALLYIFFETRFCCYLLWKEVAEEMERMWDLCLPHHSHSLTLGLNK